jgi:hypothetical protein
VLIRLPDTWPGPVVAAVAMLALAALDLGGSFAAKEAVERHSPQIGLLACALFVLLFWVYASSLQYAELALVTLGWVVILQVGVIMLDRLRYGSDLSLGKWLAMGVILTAQAYLLAGSSPSSGQPRQHPVVTGADGHQARVVAADGHE